MNTSFLIVRPSKIILYWSASKIILHVLARAMDAEGDRKVLAQFKDENGVLVKAPFDIPIDITPDLLQSLCNALVEEVMYCVAESSR